MPNAPFPKLYQPLTLPPVWEKTQRVESPKRPAPQAERSPSVPSPASYAELHCRTNYSFLTGASHPDELVMRAAEQGLGAIAITDWCSLAGVVKAHVAGKAVGLKLLIGAEITPIDAPPVVLWVMNRSGYGHLCRLITLGRRRGKKGTCELRFEDIATQSEGLLAGVPLRSLIRPAGEPVILDDLHRYRDLFGDECYALVSRHLGSADAINLSRMLRWADEANLSAVASNDVRYHHPDRRYLHDVLTAIRHKTTVRQLGARLLPNAERHLKSPAEMARLFEDHPELIARTREIADRCTFSLDELRYEYPHELAPEGQTPLQYLAELTWNGAHDRYPGGIPAKVRETLQRELTLIEELRYEAYFLTVWDLVRFARSKEILCQGRGSAANSAVCYCLGITAVDPMQIDVLFERFLSKERNEAPDIDVDFEHDRREEVIQYLYQKYGRERAGLAATVITYRPRSAIRDVGKALGLSNDHVDALAKSIGVYRVEGSLADRFREAGLDPDSTLGKRLVFLLDEILGFPRHLSQHVGGMVMTRGRLDEMVPIENASMPGRTVVQWDKDDLESLGLLKVDVLALGMLSALRCSFEMLTTYHGKPMTLADVPIGDEATYDMICRADTVGVFQIESRAQMSMLPRLKPRCFYDLVIEVSLVRPGPIQGDMVHPYLRRRNGLEPVAYPSDAVREVLAKTLGIPIFQEQAMKLAVVAAGFTPGEADELRRAMAAWRRKGIIHRFQEKLRNGLLENGYAPEFAERLYNQIKGFGEYGFPESHAASFAKLAYISSWIKCHYPEVFTAALLNSQPMGFYAPAQLVRDAQEHGVEVRPVDVNHSDWDCTLEPPSADHTSATDRQPLAIRLGLRRIKSLSFIDAKRLVTARGNLPFTDFENLATRTGLSSAVLTRLGDADAFGSLDLSRRESLWKSLPARQSEPLLEEIRSEETLPDLPPLTMGEEVLSDYRTGGLSLKGHPMQFLREMLSERGAITTRSANNSPHGRMVLIAGIVLMRQRPGSAKGVTFLTLEDETGSANLIVWPMVWEQHHRAARTARVLLAGGEVQRQGKIVHIVVRTLTDLSNELANVPLRSRDFH